MPRSNVLDVRCAECGRYIDADGLCECDRLAMERIELEKLSRKRKLIMDNIRMMEEAKLEYEWS